ncbi:MAG: GNAT family N-acetyltransferase [Saprospiraceae bacterium]|nr:GNAT family N-acetyltransferase [Saprospiraceae bacterium]
MELTENNATVDIRIEIGNASHEPYAQFICDLIEESAKVRGTGIAKRDPNYIKKKLSTGHAVVAFDGERLIGFCYVESWGTAQYVSNSGLIVDPEYRKHGMARKIKKAAFNLARDLYPYAKVFGITTSGPVMKINTELGYMPVPFSELTQDDQFWKGCSSCPNYHILQEKQRKMCLCTGMLAPSKMEEIEKKMKLDLSHQIINNNHKNGKDNAVVLEKEKEYREFEPVRFATDFF